MSAVAHKLRVFISSRCGGKYTIARKALKELLLTTGIVGEVYVFESEPASSEDTVSAYLDQVDDANLCIFLIDNKDGVSAPVLSEEKRAKEKGLRLIYVFCTENENQPTVMQTEIKDKMTQKYQEVSSFSDVVKAAYDSVMQDIVNVYKKRHFTERLQSDVSEVYSEETKCDSQSRASTTATSSPYLIGDGTSFSKQYLKGLSLTERQLLSFISYDRFYDGTESNDFDADLSSFLCTVFYKNPFIEKDYDSLCGKLIESRPEYLTQFLTLRYSAIRYYYMGEYHEALNQLRTALDESVHNADIPNWLSLDVAIDIRCIVTSLDEFANRYVYQNEGQKFIENNPEMVCYPEIDRYVNDYKEKLFAHFCKLRYASPYTTFYGGIEPIISPVVKAFCIACANGSLVQILMTIKRVEEILYVLTDLYDDHEVKVELTREAIIHRNTNRLDEIYRAKNEAIESLNSSDAARIMESLDNIKTTQYQIMSKCVALSYLGYYFDDIRYKRYSAELLRYAEQWLGDEKRMYHLGQALFKFLINNCYRIDNDVVVQIVTEVFNRNLGRWYDDCMKVLERLDFSRISSKSQEKVLHLLTTIINNGLQGNIIGFERVLVLYAKGATIPLNSFLELIKEKDNAFYENILRLELLPDDSEEHEAFILKEMAAARHENETQGVNGAYIGYASNPLDTIKNIILNSELNLKDDIIKQIIDIVIDTLSRPTQTASAKSSAIRLLIVLYHMYSDCAHWCSIPEALVKSKETFSHGEDFSATDKYSNYNLGFAYQLMLLVFGQISEEEPLEFLLTLDLEETYNIIDTLRILHDLFLNNDNPEFSEEFVSGCTHFAIMTSSIAQGEVKLYSVRCLIEMIKYKKQQRLILKFLSKVMDDGTQAMKIAILTRVKRIKDHNNSYGDYVLQKGTVDNNYLVRLAAQIHA